MSSLTLPGSGSGRKLTGADYALLLAALPQVLVKSADQSVVSTTTQTNITDLVGTVAADTNYVLRAVLWHSAATTGDINYGVTVPSGTTYRMTPDAFPASATGFTNAVYRQAVTSSPFGAIAGNGTGSSNAIMTLLEMSLVVGSTAGSVQLTFAQGTSDGSSTTVHLGSYMTLQKAS